jgi:hypothetical protein
MKYLKSFFIIILSLAMNCCAEADAMEKKSKTNAFSKIDKRDKKLFTKEERIESYNKSVNKSKSLNKALSSNSNSGYSGYGSSPSKKNKTENRSQKNKKKNMPKVNLQFSAYSTN